MLGVSIILAIGTYVGCLVSTHQVATIVAVTCAAFFMAIYATRGNAANMIAIQLTAVIVVLSGIPATSHNPVLNSLAVLGGGLVQTLLLVVVWPFMPHNAERRSIAIAFDSLAKFVAHLRNGEPESPVPDGQPFQDAWLLVDETREFRLRPEQRFLLDVLRSAEVIRAGLAGLGRADRELRHCGPEGEARASAVSTHLEKVLLEIAEGIKSGRMPEFEANPSGSAPNEIDAQAWNNHAYWTDLLQRVLTQTTKLSPDDYQGVEEAFHPVPDRSTGWLGLIERFGVPKTIALRSLLAQHALRYAIIVGGTTELSHFWGVRHAYWLPLTTCLILRPDYATTLSRGFGRLTGTFIGVSIAAALALFVPHNPLIACGFMLVSAWLAFSLYLANYMLFAAAVTLYVVYSIATSGLSDHSASLERIEATLFGVLICIATTLLWPIWESKKTGAVLKDALQAQIAYCDDIQAKPEEATMEATEESRRYARGLRVEAERVVNAGALEPSWGRRRHKFSGEDVLTRLDENAAIILSLQAEAIGGSDEKVAAFRDGMQAAIKTAQELEDSLPKAEVG